MGTRMFNRISFQQKISAVVASAMVAITVVCALSIWQTREAVVAGKHDALHVAVYSARSVVMAYQAAAAAGKMSEADAKQAAIAAVRTARYGADAADFFYMHEMEGRILSYPPKAEWEGQAALGKFKDLDGGDFAKLMMDRLRASKDGTASVDAHFPRPGTAAPLPKLYYSVLVPGWDWMIGSGIWMDDVDAQVRATVIQQFLVGLVMVVAIGAISWAIKRSLYVQLGGDPREAVQAMAQVADGNLAIDLVEAPAGSLLGSLRRMVDSMRGTLSQVRSSTDSISTASSEIAAGNQDLSLRTEQTASNLQQAASSMAQLTTTVRQSADAASEANRLATSAAEVASRGGSVVAQVVSTMDDINTSSKKIADIIGVIDGIAFQTNILALNAAVEAARAGEQGRGFAVVASEVRSLAQRSAGAAKEIKGLIGASVEKVENGSRLVADAGRTMTEIVSSVQRVSDIIAEITSASKEQSLGIGAINGSVTQLDQMTQQNAALVEQAAAAAESLRAQAGRLAEVVETFRLG